MIATVESGATSCEEGSCEVTPRRVLLVDDHVLIRQGLRSLLEQDADIRVVGEAPDAEQAIQILARTPCDFVLMDLGLPGRDGFWCLEEIGRRWPGLPVLILTMHVDGESARRAFDLGARAYVVKSSTREGLVEALRAVEQGNSYVSPRVLTLFLEALHKEKAEPDPLTPREREVLALVGEGLGNHAISHHLHLSLSTVKTHLRAMYNKLNTNRAGLVAEAVRRDLVGRGRG